MPKENSHSKLIHLPTYLYRAVKRKTYVEFCKRGTRVTETEIIRKAIADLLRGDADPEVANLIDNYDAEAGSLPTSDEG